MKGLLKNVCVACLTGISLAGPAASCDICIVGGGVAGVAAALQAGRAGAAAALAARRKCDVRQVPLDELKSALRASGAIVPSK